MKKKIEILINMINNSKKFERKISLLNTYHHYPEAKLLRKRTNKMDIKIASYIRKNFMEKQK